MIASLVALLARLGGSGIVDRAITLIEKRGELANDREKIAADLSAEYLRQVVNETRIMADYNTDKLSFPWFWIFAAAFLGPLALWWSAVILDSVFNFPWDVANLPTPEMRAWAGNMIQWIFYVGSGAGALRAVIRR
ncbi:hypothetical protein [Martelella soudanensis]|uniref:hypothetical protein n=1 Tax=unclassified Martelella TaxID=2629616 RepID=UPI001AEE5B1B|nr:MULTISPECIES: hypothetical protein [unclassified Martelella]